MRDLPINNILLPFEHEPSDEETQHCGSPMDRKEDWDTGEEYLECRHCNYNTLKTE